MYEWFCIRFLSLIPFFTKKSQMYEMKMTDGLTPRLAQDFALPVLATVAWAMMTQAFGLVQIFASASHPRKSDPNSRFDYTYERWRVADRTMMNSVEQHGVFLGMVWMHAVFVDAPMAGALGLAAVASRAMYPILRGVMQVLLEISTHGYHVCMGTMCCNLVSLSLRGTRFVEARSCRCVSFIEERVVWGWDTEGQ